MSPSDYSLAILVGLQSKPIYAGTAKDRPRRKRLAVAKARRASHRRVEVALRSQTARSAA